MMYHRCQAVGYCDTGFKRVCGLTVQDYPGKAMFAHDPKHPNIPDDPTLVVVTLLLLPTGSAADGGSVL